MAYALHVAWAVKQAETYPQSGLKDSAKTAKKRHVLIVDDSSEIVSVLTEALEQKGYEVGTASNGSEALDSVKVKMPDIILLDMRMPIMNGWEFAREFRNRYGRSVPITVMTAAEDSRLRANEVGADSYIGKPFDLDQLYQVIEDTLPD